MNGVSLGSAAIFLVALVAGHFKGVAFQDIASWQESLPAVDHYFKLVQNLGLVLFVTSVGLIAGPSFFKNLKKNEVLCGTGRHYHYYRMSGLCSHYAACSKHQYNADNPERVRNRITNGNIAIERTCFANGFLCCCKCRRTGQRTGKQSIAHGRMMQLAASRKSCLKWISSASQHFS